MKKLFKRIYIEILNYCNLNCTFCDKTKKTKKSITREEFNHILTQIKPYTDYIYLHVQGEPLLHKDLFNLLSDAKELGLVDELGGLDKAIQIAAEKVGIEEYSVINYPAKEGFFASLMNQGKEDYIESKVSETLGDYYHYLKFIENIKEADRIQARMPFDLRIK